MRPLARVTSTARVPSARKASATSSLMLALVPWMPVAEYWALSSGAVWCGAVMTLSTAVFSGFSGSAGSVEKTACRWMGESNC